MAKSYSSKATPARVLALALTRQVRERDAYLRELINTARATTKLDAEEFDYAQVLAYGVVMCQGTLDEAINRSLNSPRDIKAKVRDALRISAYELLFLHKPEHVVVNEGVELVRSVAPKATGLANAVLRKMVADAKDFPWGDVDEDTAALARSFGMPEWLAAKLVDQYGREQAVQIMEADMHSAPTYLHENPFDPEQPFASDLSAQHVAELVPLEGTILEIGAGRGTKTMLIESRAQETLGHTVPVHAVDLHEYRAELHAKRMQEAGIKDVLSLEADARNLSAIEGLQESYESILLDAPCSGTGTMRRHPEIRWRLTPQDVDELAQLQLELLTEAASRTAPGGKLVYATCSILDEENQQVIDKFLAMQNPDAWVIGDDSFATVPTFDGPDGHFCCILRKK